MSQPTVASYFNTRKRAAIDNLGGAARNKVLVLDGPTVETTGNLTNSSLNSDNEQLRFVHANIHNFTLKNVTDGSGSINGTSSHDDPSELGRRITRASRAIKRIGPVELDEKTKALLSASAQPKLVSFVKKGNLSPQKRPHGTPSPMKGAVVPAKKMATPTKDEPEAPARAEFSPRNNSKNVEKATPGKAASISKLLQKGKEKDALSLEEIRTKLLNHPRLSELKTQINKVKSGMDALQRMEEEHLTGGSKPIAPPSPGTAARNLQKFTTMDVEVLVSPKKQLTSPSRAQHTPTKNNLQSQANNVTPKRMSALMSPIKEPSSATPVMDGSPKKLPPYQRYCALALPGTPSLHLPYKYRALLELFKCTDTVCAMFHNRKEQITFKKLKPAVQRMARKNFYESHLAQIQHLFPDAFIVSQELTKNYGSATKHDTYQLVIKPNVQEKTGDAKEKKTSQDSDTNIIRTLQNHTMNPQVMTERYQRFHRLLLEKVKDAHQEFLLSRNPPLHIDREQVRRWHVDFNLENCPELEQAELPQPPNVERFSTAKDVLSTARNLFNCGTTMERALARLEEKKRQAAAAAAAAAASSLAATTNDQDADEKKPDISKLSVGVNIRATSKTEPNAEEDDQRDVNDIVSSVLKNVPKALLEKIRAKQAAKALDQMTRRPSQDTQALKYSRLPEIARHLRNVFVTERKNVLPLETPLVKIENSYRGKLSLQELEEHIRLIAQLVPSWLTLPEVRKVKYAKIAKDCDLMKVIGVLEQKANEAVQ